MKKLIKKSIDEIKLNESQKEEIYQNIVNKKNKGFNRLFKYAFVCFIIIFCILVVDKPNNNEELMVVHANDLVIDNNMYAVAYIDYELGERLEDVTFGGKIYEVYENNLIENSIVLYNEYYEVYLKIEE